jgi:hypothetical protein
MQYSVNSTINCIKNFKEELMHFKNIFPYKPYDMNLGKDATLRTAQNEKNMLIINLSAGNLKIGGKITVTSNG